VSKTTAKIDAPAEAGAHEPPLSGKPAKAAAHPATEPADPHDKPHPHAAKHPTHPAATAAAHADKPPSTKVSVKAPSPAPAPQADASATAAAKAPARAPAPKASKTPPVMPQSPPSPLTSSRFADRFAPPKPPTRQMNNLIDDVVKTPQKVDPKLANAWKTKAGRDLTEPELLSMPDSEYMNEKQLDFFRARLQALKDDLLSNAGETTEHLREDTSIVPDPADRATIEEEHALELRTRDRERKLLKKISQSLARLDSGDYGFCDETGEPIGLGRLIARPTATLSLEAQQRREMKQKMFGD